MMLRFEDIHFEGRRVILREDFNVPMAEGKITDDARIIAALPTIRALVAAPASVIILSHLGRPKIGQKPGILSLKPVADYLSGLLNQPVQFFDDLSKPPALEPGDVALFENIRLLRGEKENDATLAKQLGTLGECFVMDAFGVAHRAHASTVGITHYVKQAIAGPLLQKELSALKTALDAKTSPSLAIVGGAKVSGKLTLLQALAERVECLITGGGIANTFIAAMGYEVGRSLYEPELIPEAKKLLDRISIPLPKDVVVAEKLAPDVKTEIVPIDQVSPNQAIFDVGPETLRDYRDRILQSKTVLWNGPLGVFECPPFANGTKALAEAIAESDAFSLAGGGDTLAAIKLFHVKDRISYISTGGGAFLEALSGQVLPAIAALE